MALQPLSHSVTQSGWVAEWLHQPLCQNGWVAAALSTLVKVCFCICFFCLVQQNERATHCNNCQPKAMIEMIAEMKLQRYNVRSYHTYLDEDCIGTVKNIARRCHRKLLELRTLMRWLLRLKFYLRHWPLVRQKNHVSAQQVPCDKPLNHKPRSLELICFYDFLNVLDFCVRRLSRSQCQDYLIQSPM
jgi:hypothetical protein